MKINLDNSVVASKGQTTIYEKKNFLEDEDFKNLQKNFPSVNYFNKIRKSDDAEEKFSSTHEMFKDFISKHHAWEKFYNTLNSEKFIRSAYFKTLIPSIKARGLNALRIWTTKKKPNFLRFFFSTVYTHITITIQKKGQKVYPHKDTENKLMSMIYYMPDTNNIIDDSSGTEFWKTNKNFSKWKNFYGHVINELDDFKKDNQIILKSKFEQNKVVFFVRNNLSWHSVLEVDNDKNKLRKTVNIFIRFNKN